MAMAGSRVGCALSAPRGRLRGQPGNELEFALAAKKKIPIIRMAKKNKEPAIRGKTVSRRAVLQGISLAGLALPLMQFLTPSEGKAQGAEQKSGTITEESKMADQTLRTCSTQSAAIL